MSPAENALLLEPLKVFNADVRQRLSQIYRLSTVVVLGSENHG